MIWWCLMFDMQIVAKRPRSSNLEDWSPLQAVAKSGATSAIRSNLRRVNSSMQVQLAWVQRRSSFAWLTRHLNRIRLQVWSATNSHHKGPDPEGILKLCKSFKICHSRLTHLLIRQKVHQWHPFITSNQDWEGRGRVCHIFPSQAICRVGYSRFQAYFLWRLSKSAICAEHWSKSWVICKTSEQIHPLYLIIKYYQYQ